MNTSRIKLMTGFIIFVSVEAFAGQQWCSGTINHTYLDHGGTLYINGSWRDQHTAVCNVNMERYGVSQDTCKGWLSVAMAAKLSKTKVVVHYSDVPSCGEIPQYGAAPKPSYFAERIDLTNNYF